MWRVFSFRPSAVQNKNKKTWNVGWQKRKKAKWTCWWICFSFLASLFPSALFLYLFTLSLLFVSLHPPPSCFSLCSLLLFPSLSPCICSFPSLSLVPPTLSLPLPLSLPSLSSPSHALSLTLFPSLPHTLIPLSHTHSSLTWLIVSWYSKLCLGILSGCESDTTEENELCRVNMRLYCTAARDQ